MNRARLGARLRDGVAWALRPLARAVLLRQLRAQRQPHPEQAPAGLPEAVRSVWLPGPNGRRLFAWFLPPPMHQGCRGPTVLVMHGWGAHAGLMLPAVPALAQAGLGALVLDARCHGLSEGEDFTSMPRFAEDIAAGLAWLRQQPTVECSQLALLGHSVGAAAALLHAARHGDVRAVVSLSVFAHPAELMRRWMAEMGFGLRALTPWVLSEVQRIIGARFDDIAPLSTLPRVACPVLLVHGADDQTVPVGEAYRLAAAAPAARLMILPGCHDLGPSIPPHAAELAGFLRRACRPDAADTSD